MMPASVLYVEDDENDAFFMQRAFERLNQKAALRIVTDGSEAIHVLESRREQAPPRLLLLDVKLPSCGGLEVLQWVRAQPQFASTTVAMVTSSTVPSDIELAAARGANAFLVKPSNAGTLDRVVGPLLELCEAEPPPRGRLPVAGNRLP